MNSDSLVPKSAESVASRAVIALKSLGCACALVMLSSLSGCDKLPKMGEEKSEPPKPTVSAPAPTPQPQVAQEQPKPQVTTPAPVKRSPDEVIEAFKRTPPHEVTDAMLVELASMDDSHRALITEIKISAAKDVTIKGLQTLPSFQNLKTLEANQLGLGRNSQALGELGRCADLETLSIVKTGLQDGDLTPLVSLQNLKAIVLDNNSVGDHSFDQLAKMRGLERLYISGLQINGAGMNFFNDKKLKHPGLKVIVANQTQFGLQGLPAINGWKSIEELSIAQASVNDNTLAALNQCANLRVLNLGHDSFSAIGLNAANFKAKKKLEHLSIINVKGVTDASLGLFKTNKTLKTLNLTGCSVTPAGVNQLRKILKTTQIIADGVN